MATAPYHAAPSRHGRAPWVVYFCFLWEVAKGKSQRSCEGGVAGVWRCTLHYSSTPAWELPHGTRVSGTHTNSNTTRAVAAGESMSLRRTVDMISTQVGVGQGA
eukprot:877626-Rhodomonas_salina.1